ncbi:MAG: hypothetical protein M5U31_04675 [Acidimicrobiia bacterium]|nr:hypothetical protein [Acidimicrobiia bacterium]
MKRRTKFTIAGVAAAVAVVGAGTGIGVASSGGDDQPLVGTDLDQATAAALEHTGGGTVTETEIGDDGAAYGVEIQLGDGSQVEVNLDKDFQVIGSAADDDGPGNKDDGDSGEGG